MTNDWRITWRDRSWTADDLLASDLASVQALVGFGWASCDPWAGPMELVAMVAVLDARATDREVVHALAEVRAVPARDLTAAIERI